METTYAAALMWFRRDLRAEDHAALSQALRAAGRVPVSLCSTGPSSTPCRAATGGWNSSASPRWRWTPTCARWAAPGRGLICLHGTAEEEVTRLAARLGVQAVFANHDEDPAAIARRPVRERLAAAGVALHTFKDHVVFERDEVLTQAGKPYSVFTPYSRAWLARLDAADLRPRGAGPRRTARAPARRSRRTLLQELGFEPTNLRTLKIVPGSAGRALLRSFTDRIDRYDTAARLPAVKGPATSACTCASAPCRSANWCARRASTTAAAPPPG